MLKSSESAVIYMAEQEIIRIAQLVKQQTEAPLTLQEAIKIVRLVAREASIYD